MAWNMNKPSASNRKNSENELQLKFFDGLEEKILAEVYPWRKSCQKIKQVMQDFLKKVE
jgi:hypothetical protein